MSGQVRSQDTGPYDQFIIFGDSITQFSCSQDMGFAFSPALQNAFIRRLDVINRGFSGYNTTQALQVLPSFMPKPEQARIRFMAIFFGANDACLPSSPTGQQVPLPQYIANLKLILTHPSVVAHQPRLILITPPPINEYQTEASDRIKGYAAALRSAEHTKKYADATREVGKESGVAVLDIWGVIMGMAGWEEGRPLVGSREVERSEVLEGLFVDGLHFLPTAYKVLYESMMELIAREWPDQDPTTLPFVFPTWTVAPP
ncbi:hypothetical protein MMC28_001472 [Mycoblastus sanguinarius]|nr:hypothetical protein [Mycoblastus sanguinarius]